jgi:hypothetical protein
MDAAKFHKVNEKIDLNDNKLREWVHSQRCVVEPPLQAVKCHGLPTTALQSHRELMPHDVHPTARNPTRTFAVPGRLLLASRRKDGGRVALLPDRPPERLVWRRLQEQLSELRGTTVTQVAFAEAAQRIQALDEASRKLLEKVRPCSPSHYAHST